MIYLSVLHKDHYIQTAMDFLTQDYLDVYIIMYNVFDTSFHEHYSPRVVPVDGAFISRDVVNTVLTNSFPYLIQLTYERR